MTSPTRVFHIFGFGRLAATGCVLENLCSLKKGVLKIVMGNL